jgi:hypothetical protein
VPKKTKKKKNDLKRKSFVSCLIPLLLLENCFCARQRASLSTFLFDFPHEIDIFCGEKKIIFVFLFRWNYRIAFQQFGTVFAVGSRFSIFF